MEDSLRTGVLCSFYLLLLLLSYLAIAMNTRYAPTPDIVIVVCCAISYHYECTIFDDRGVKMVHLGVYCNVDMVDGGL